MRIVNCTTFSFGYVGVPAPAVQAYLYIPRIVYGRWITFMIDTGAAGTCINGFYAWAIQGKLQTRTLLTSSGIGGHCEYYHERAMLLFMDANRRPVAKGTLLGIQRITTSDISQNTDKLRLPCLLGRDILSRCEFPYSIPSNRIILIFS